MQGTTGLAWPPADHRTFGVVDELNCYFDSPAEPNNVHMEIWLPGHLDPGALRDAVTAMLVAQPRAGARRADRGWWRRDYAWEFPPQPGADPVSTACWRTEADLDLARARFLATAPPLDRSPPFRLLLARGPGRDSLILNAHHAAFDGRSCLRLLHLIADWYGAGGPAEPPGQPQPPSGTRPPASQLPANHSPVRRFRPPVRRFRPRPRPRLRLRLWRTVRIASRHDTGRRSRRAPGYGFALLEWPGVPAAPQPGVTVNDLLIAALIRAILRWNASAHRRPGRVRISMPVDVRPPGRGDELGNLTRLCTVAADPLGTAALTAVVAEQTRRAKHHPGPLVSPAQAAVARAPLPTSVKRRVLRLAVRCLGRLDCDTSLLSNLGNVTDAPRFGVLSPARMWFSTSAHMPRGLSVGAITVDGQLHLCFRYRHALFDTAAAQDFVAEYAAALAALAGPLGPRCSGQICPQQRAALSRTAMPQAEGMAHEDKNPLFSERVREQLLLQRILVLDGALDDDNGTLLATRLFTLAADDPAADVALWINSPGGSVPSMLAIRDVMRLVPCDVSTLALGLACSAGQFLLSAGAKGKRFALPHARILMHRGSAGIGGSAVEIEVQADDLRHMVDTVLGLIAEDTGQPVERIFDDSLHDHWYTAAEARDYGFIDGIVDSFGQVMPARKHRIGLQGAVS